MQPEPHTRCACPPALEPAQGGQGSPSRAISELPTPETKPELGRNETKTRHGN